MNTPLRLKIEVQYLNGEWQHFFSYNTPKFQGDKVLINTEYGVVELERNDLMRLRHTTVFKEL